MVLRDDARARLCLARDLLYPSADGSLSVAEVAREAGMSPFHFIRRFAAVFGVTPHQFRTQERLHQAKLLLAAGNRSVTEVCFEVGFDSLGSFSDLFSRRVGTSPSAYRRSAKLTVRMPAEFPQRLFPGCLSLMGALPASAFRNFREANPGRLR